MDYFENKLYMKNQVEKNYYVCCIMQLQLNINELFVQFIKYLNNYSRTLCTSTFFVCNNVYDIKI